MKARFSIVSIIAGMAMVLVFFALSSFEPGEKNPRNQHTVDASKYFEVPGLPNAIDFAGEAVPLSRWEVRDALDHELLYNFYQPGNILLIMKLSQKYFPLIERELQANGVPDDFKYLCVAESTLQNLVSKVGATGFWQFMKGTAPGYNLEIAATVDERYNVIKSTRAACTYLKTAHKKIGNWTAAAASYNCGMGGYNQRVIQQGTNNYYELVLPQETQKYIFRILTFKHILSNADSLGFKLPEAHENQQPKTKTITVTKNIPNLVSFAKENGTDYKILKLLNPWLRSQSLTVKPGKKYEIVVPE